MSNEVNDRCVDRFDRHREQINELQLKLEETKRECGIKTERLIILHTENKREIEIIKNTQLVELESIVKGVNEGLNAIKTDLKVIRYSALTFVIGLVAQQIGLVELVRKLLL